SAIGKKPEQITEDTIRKRAYEIYCTRNGGLGNEVDDWFKAETELRGGRLIAARCPGTLADGRPCSADLVDRDEPLVHYAGAGDQGDFTHHRCKLGHAWHRDLNDDLLMPCDCSRHAPGSVRGREVR